MASQTKPLLGRLLLRHRLISAAQLEEALRKQEKTGKLLGQILVEMGAISQDDLGRILELQQQTAAE